MMKRIDNYATVLTNEQAILERIMVAFVIAEMKALERLRFECIHNGIT